ncbi:MAG: DUF417 family protein [Acidobacteria bacterium]|nr:DUF417 family protein [Acidobacteriota bacterium]
MDPTRDTETPGGMLERFGEIALRYGLVAILLWVGALKFTAYEAEGIEPLVANSPLMSWAYLALGLRPLASLIGVVEIVLALMIATRSFAPRVSAIGSLGAIGTFLITLTFIVTTPGVWQPGYGFPFPSPMPGQFLLKDLMLLAVAIWTAGEAMRPRIASRDEVSPRHQKPSVRSHDGAQVRGSATTGWRGSDERENDATRTG